MFILGSQRKTSWRKQEGQRHRKVTYGMGCEGQKNFLGSTNETNDIHVIPAAGEGQAFAANKCLVSVYHLLSRCIHVPIPSALTLAERFRGTHLSV